jgi:hypothetical protein
VNAPAEAGDILKIALILAIPLAIAVLGFVALLRVLRRRQGG